MIATYGNQLLTLNIGLRRTIQWVFIIADVKNPIIGADFLRHYGLLVDVEHNQLVDNITQLRAIVTPCTTEQPVKHSVTHYIDTSGPPVHARPRRFSPKRLNNISNTCFNRA